MAQTFISFSFFNYFYFILFFQSSCWHKLLALLGWCNLRCWLSMTLGHNFFAVLTLACFDVFSLLLCTWFAKVISAVFTLQNQESFLHTCQFQQSWGILSSQTMPIFFLSKQLKQGGWIPLWPKVDLEHTEGYHNFTLCHSLCSRKVPWLHSLA